MRKLSWRLQIPLDLQTLHPLSFQKDMMDNLLDFSSLGLADHCLVALRAEGYERPTPIQTLAIPPVLEGRDLLGCAQTGTGKTAAFALPIIHNLAATRSAARHGRGTVRALIVAPTRELAAQIDDSFDAYGRDAGLKRACVFGGVGKTPQIKALSRGVDVLVATPGRLLDLHSEGDLTLAQVEIVVLDEADRMLDMGFIHDVRRIVALLPKKRQTLLFSATMPSEIETLARSLLSNPVRVAVSPEKPAVELIEQRLMFVDKGNKRNLLVSLVQDDQVRRAIVFTRTKHGANRLAEALEHAGIGAAAIHANKSQNHRIRTMDGFREGRLRILVATDLAARGIDVDGITHVFNFDLPTEPETYVHRIGRTARAGASGTAISFCDAEERRQLKQIERLLGHSVPVVSDHPFAGMTSSEAALDDRPDRRPRPGQSRGGRPPHGHRQSGGGHPRPDRRRQTRMA